MKVKKVWIFLAAFVLGVSLAGLASMTKNFNDASVYALVQVVPHHEEEVYLKTKGPLPQGAAGCRKVREEAQNQSKQIRNEARKEAGKILQEAEAKCRQIQKLALEECRKLRQKPNAL